ncbi:uncharacterized protein [Aegilops tauschii subsp. strangulata]|uniref:uncharacterized protein n=1 Tax=Aegilops tauschii subsp. strangulata TaxID=200361 RepID=UPI00098B2990
MQVEVQWSEQDAVIRGEIEQRKMLLLALEVPSVEPQACNCLILPGFGLGGAFNGATEKSSSSTASSTTVPPILLVLLLMLLLPFLMGESLYNFLLPLCPCY